MNFLIIDDCLEDREIAKTWLSVFGDIAFDEVETIEDGLTAFGKKHYSAVILDYSFPTTTAEDFLSQISESQGRTPIIVLSGRVDEKAAVGCIKLGASDYVKKDGLLSLGLVARERLLLSIEAAKTRRKNRNFSHRNNLAVERSIEAAKSAQAASDSANISKSAFLANMSHEIRSPLTSIIGFTDLIKDSGVSDQALEYANAIERNGKHLLSIINEILDFSKIEAGKVLIDNADFSIRKLISDIVFDFKQTASAKNIGLRIFFHPNLPDMVVSDIKRVKQILTNLISNALKFTSHGEVVIIAQKEKSAEGIDRLSISVSDTGEGMTSTESRKLFNRFTQANEKVESKHGGTGLGLVISKKYANLLGGDLDLVSSEKGIGSLFRLVIPSMGAEDLLAMDDETIAAAPGVVQSLVGRRIMVIDDSPDNQLLILYYLKKQGFNLSCFSSGWDAIERIDEIDPELILMDVQMPSISGHETSRRLRKKGFTKPILGLTANALPEDELKSRLAGFNAQMTKPIDPKLLVDTIKAHLGMFHISIH